MLSCGQGGQVKAGLTGHTVDANRKQFQLLLGERWKRLDYALNCFITIARWYRSIHTAYS